MVAAGARANPEDEAALASAARDLASTVDAVLAAWVVRSVERILVAYEGEADEGVLDEARAAGATAARDVGGRIRDLLAADVDAQRASPLAELRDAVRYATDVLRSAGVPPVVRDEFSERSFPYDLYDLAPATFADVDPALHEPGLVWGAAKAHVHLARRRAEGLR